MGIFNLFRKRKENNRAYSRVELISEQCNTFFSWQGTTYNSDIVRACIRPKVKAVGKAIIKQLKELEKNDVEGDEQSKIIEKPVKTDNGTFYIEYINFHFDENDEDNKIKDLVVEGFYLYN